MAEKTEKVLGNGFTRIDTVTKDGDKSYPVSYEIPSTPADFKAFVASLNGDALEYAWTRYNYGHDLASRQKVKPSAGGETTIVRIGQKDVDLMTLPAAVVCRMVMAARDRVALGGKPSNSLEYTAKALVAAKRAIDKDGAIAPAPGQK